MGFPQSAGGPGQKRSLLASRQAPESFGTCPRARRVYRFLVSYAAPGPRRNRTQLTLADRHGWGRLSHIFGRHSSVAPGRPDVAMLSDSSTERTSPPRWPKYSSTHQRITRRVSARRGAIGTMFASSIRPLQQAVARTRARLLRDLACILHSGPVSKSDSPAGQIVRRHRDRHMITGENMNAEPCCFVIIGLPTGCRGSRHDRTQKGLLAHSTPINNSQKHGPMPRHVGASGDITSSAVGAPAVIAAPAIHSPTRFAVDDARPFGTSARQRQSSVELASAV